MISKQLCDLLIKPIQRIMKYELLLRDIYKHSERAGLVQELPGKINNLTYTNKRQYCFMRILRSINLMEIEFNNIFETSYLTRFTRRYVCYEGKQKKKISNNRRIIFAHKTHFFHK